MDYAKTPAEDFATGMITYRNPETGQKVKAQFTNSWMFEKQGLRLFMDGMGPGYAFEINTLVSPLNIFIGDVAAEAIKDAELALEKATASRGLLAVQYNEPDLYGYTDENADAMDAFLAGRDGMLPWSYGLEITRLVMAVLHVGREEAGRGPHRPGDAEGTGDLRPADPAGAGAGAAVRRAGGSACGGQRARSAGSGSGSVSRLRHPLPAASCQLPATASTPRGSCAGPARWPPRGW